VVSRAVSRNDPKLARPSSDDWAWHPPCRVPGGMGTWAWGEESFDVRAHWRSTTSAEPASCLGESPLRRLVSWSNRN